MITRTSSGQHFDRLRTRSREKESAATQQLAEVFLYVSRYLVLSVT